MTDPRPDDAVPERLRAAMARVETQRRTSAPTPSAAVMLSRVTARPAGLERKTLTAGQAVRLSLDLARAQLRLLPRSGLVVLVLVLAAALVLASWWGESSSGVGLLSGGDVVGAGALVAITAAGALCDLGDLRREELRAAWVRPATVVAARLVVYVGIAVALAAVTLTVAHAAGVVLGGAALGLHWLVAGLLGAGVATVLGLVAGQVAAWSTGAVSIVVLQRVVLADPGALASITVMAAAALVVFAAAASLPTRLALTSPSAVNR